ncbi:MAG: hypothetical protein GF317_18145 [Candidatus Lokiarchaeota archaeon]|nr:hypothetical protein [Candidatus Lokiarchaeota archaeon]MBD3201435.1 hypothetical protein [Candidatus Lokiarchaeota archaeon]
MEGKREVQKYISYQAGNVPLILSIPHGGTIKPKEILDRERGITGIDKGTIKIGTLLAEYLSKYSTSHLESQITPYYVIAKIARKKIDFNRKLKEACNHSSEIAKEIYKFYHQKLRTFIDKSLKTHKRSLLIDIHGFEKYKRPKGYRIVDVVLGTNNLKSISPHQIPKKHRNKNIRGNLINELLKLDLSIAPAHSRRREYVLKGGYITSTYGASNIENSQSIQIEFSETIRIHNSELRHKVIKAIGKCIIDEIM